MVENRCQTNKELDRWAQQMDDNGLTPPFLALDFEGEQDDLVHQLERPLTWKSWTCQRDPRNEWSQMISKKRGREQRVGVVLCFSMHIKTAILLR